MRLLALLLTCTLALGADKAAKPEDKPAATKSALDEIHLGAAVLGEFKIEDAKGKALVIDFWGVRCPPCIASLPDMQKLYRTNKDKVLFVGVESQGHSKEQIEPVIKKAGVTYPIVSGFSGLPQGIKVSGLPHVVVIDAAGKVVFDGSPFDAGFAKAIRTAASTVKK